MTKQEIRHFVRARIKEMSAEERQAESLALCQQIKGTPLWQQAHVVMLYCAMTDEISLDPLWHEAISAGKSIVLPVVDGDKLLLRLYVADKMAVQGRFQILEPTEECPLFTDLKQLDLAIIPGRAFSPSGHRLGRGKGYYDKLLPQVKCPKWGVAFQCQHIDELPIDPWDIPMDQCY